MDLFEVTNRYDEQEQKKRHLEDKLEKSEYLTFYEKILLNSKAEPLTVTILFTLFLFLLHLGASILQQQANQYTIIEDFSFFLSVLNGVGLYLLYNATQKLREFIINLILLRKADNTKEEVKPDKFVREDAFIKTYKKNFLGRRTLFYGLFFGIINVAMSLVFGIYYLELNFYYLLITFCLQIFTIGFIGGVTVNGTAVVVSLIRKLSVKNDLNLRYFYPDQCAGTLVIGNILFIFSIHFIIIGALIFIFIHNFDWTNSATGNYYVNALILFWKIFPFLFSSIIFFLPVQKINSILSEYKLWEQLRIRKRMHLLSNLILAFEPDHAEAKDKIEVLDSYHQKLLQLDQQIAKLNTWPYNLRYRTTFLSIFIPVLIGIILELSKNIISGFFT